MIGRRTLIGAALMSGPALAAGGRNAPDAEPMRLNPPSLPPPVGFSHISEGSGRLVWISGQVPRMPDGRHVGAGDFLTQLEQVFRNLDIAVREAGGRFADVVKLNYYCHQSVERSLLRHVSIVRDRYVDVARPPASTFAFVAGLAHPDWLIEIEAVLALPPADMMLAVHATLRAGRPIPQRLLDAARRMGEATRAEAGCLSYRFAVDVDTPAVLRLTETWQDRAALIAHFATPHMAVFREALRAESGIHTDIEVFAIHGREPLPRARPDGAGRITAPVPESAI